MIMYIPCLYACIHVSMYIECVPLQPPSQNPITVTYGHSNRLASCAFQSLKPQTIFQSIHIHMLYIYICPMRKIATFSISFKEI